MSVRARYANLTFPDQVRAALVASLGSDYEADGVDVRIVDLKGDDRRDSKRLEYTVEGTAAPARPLLHAYTTRGHNVIATAG